jgi:O-antigen ligase/TolA-binding protein
VSSIIQFFYLCLFFVTPIIFTSLTSELFEVPKMYFVYFITLIILFFHLINWLKGKTVLFSKNKLAIPLLLFFFAQLLSTIFSVDPHTSIFGYYSRLNGSLLSLSSYFLLFLILPQYLTPKFLNKIINISLFSGLLISGFGILEHFGIDKNLWVQDVQSRVFSTLGQPNWLAAYLCILLPFALDKFIKSKIFSLKSFFFLLLVSNLYLCLLFTKSKSGILAAIISISIYLIFKFFQGTNFKIFVPLLLIFLSTSIIISNPIKDYIFPPKNSPSIDQNSTLNITPSEDIRKIVWQGSVDIWKKFPLFGTGPETFAYSYYWTRPASHNLTSEWDFLYNKAHNEYLNYLATTGTLGFLTYIFFIISVAYFLIKNISSPYSLAIFTSFISILITNFAGFSVVVTSLFFFLLPAFVSPKLPAKTDQKPKNKLLYLPLIAFFLIALIKLSSFLTADLAYNQSQSSLNRQQYTLAQDFINLSLYLRPKEATYHSQASLIAAKLNQPDQAFSHSNSAISLSPASTNLWKERAQIFSLLSLTDPKYFSYAIDALEKCIRLAPTDAKTFYLLGKFYEAAEQTDLALKNYQTAFNLKSNYDFASYALGEIYFNQKNYSEAKKYFEITLQIAPTNLDAQNYLDKIGKLLIK